LFPLASLSLEIRKCFINIDAALLIMNFVSSVAITFITTFLVMDPFSSIGPFVALTKNYEEQKVKEAATTAVFIAGFIALLFTFGGLSILSLMNITLNDFKVAGGLVLALLGLEMALGISFNNEKKEKNDIETITVLIATPLLTGPGLISSLILLNNDYGFLATTLGLLLTLIFSWFILFNATQIKGLIGKRLMLIFSKIMGLLLIAMGINYIKTGLIGG
jgi:multiple antibiotic resistance protein